MQSTQASIAVSADGKHWYLVNASPDLRQQLIATPQLHPEAGQLRHSPIAGVILTNGEIDAVDARGLALHALCASKSTCDSQIQQHLQCAQR
jgi:coenzyme PQQ biosynthesis protein B